MTDTVESLIVDLLKWVGRISDNGRSLIRLSPVGVTLVQQTMSGSRELQFQNKSKTRFQDN
jgi:hypothetical protein